MNKRIFAGIVCLAMAVSLCGCDAPIHVGSAAPEITLDRGSYLALKNGTVTSQDISSVIAYIETLETVVGDLGEYTTSYDADNNTVYVMTEDGNIAFRLDDDGNVLFAAANGSSEKKASLNHGLLQVSIAACVANGVDLILNSVEEARWLNTINSNVIAATCNGYEFTQLDPSLMYVQTPSLNSLVASDLENDILSDKLTMPVLTESLSEYGVTDLTNYYEGISLTKYWEGMDWTGIKSEISDIVMGGLELADLYSDAQLDTSVLSIPEWSLSGYTLPSTFSDGTTTTLGTQTLDAFNSYQSDLSGWRDDLLSAEIAAQEAGFAGMSSSSASLWAGVQSTISSNSAATQQQGSANQAATDAKNDAAAGATNAASNANSSAVQDAYAQGQANSANTIGAAKDEYGEFYASQAETISDQAEANKAQITIGKDDLDGALKDVENRKAEADNLTSEIENTDLDRYHCVVNTLWDGSLGGLTGFDSYDLYDFVTGADSETTRGASRQDANSGATWGGSGEDEMPVPSRGDLDS